MYISENILPRRFRALLTVITKYMSRFGKIKDYQDLTNRWNIWQLYTPTSSYHLRSLPGWSKENSGFKLVRLPVVCKGADVVLRRSDAIFSFHVSVCLVLWFHFEIGHRTLQLCGISVILLPGIWPWFDVLHLQEWQGFE